MRRASGPQPKAHTSRPDQDYRIVLKGSLSSLRSGAFSASGWIQSVRRPLSTTTSAAAMDRGVDAHSGRLKVVGGHGWLEQGSSGCNTEQRFSHYPSVSSWRSTMQTVLHRRLQGRALAVIVIRPPQH